MSVVTCPKCDHGTERGGFPGWTIVVSIIFFPIGLLSLLAGRKPSICRHCGNAFVA